MLRQCARVQQLRLAQRDGNRYAGEYHKNSKLTLAAVDTIRASTKSSRELAAQFGVCRTTIKNVRNKKVWRS
jgi:hypothetical protein